ncbi:MAG: leucine-rich repeat domain-containing protein [Lachnospiraceae bacterium]|nr:leucine-rich repeat domain-containing protein [Lachnospiraceae bacterium]
MTAGKAKKVAAILIILGILLLGISGGLLLVKWNSGSGTKPELTVEDYLKQGQKYYERGDYLEAVLSYDQVLSEDEKNAEALEGLGKAYAGGQYYQDAEETYRLLLDLDGNNADAGLELVQVYLSQGKLEEARSILETLSGTLSDKRIQDMYEQTHVSAPEFSAASGSYDQYFLLELTNASPGTVVYYTLDGSEPEAGSSIYRDGIVISDPQVQVKARAVNGLGYSSECVTMDYQITVPVEEAVIPDVGLERAFMNMTGIHYQGELYNYQLAKIRELYILGEGWRWDDLEDARFYPDSMMIGEQTYTGYGDVKDISGLSYCPFLESLNIAFQEELSLAGIQQMGQLKQVSLIHNQLMDLSPLSGLTGLTKLSLGWNQIQDVSPLSGLTELQTLGLWGNQISDLSALSGLTSLYYLDVSENQISDVSVVAQMPHLSELWMYGNQISDLSCTDGLEDLKVLMARDNPITEYGRVKLRAYDFKRLDLEE